MSDEAKMILKDMQIETMRKEIISQDQFIAQLEKEYDKEIERLNSIIKEVREYITSYINQFNGVYPFVDMRYLDLNKILEILDKEGK